MTQAAETVTQDKTRTTLTRIVRLAAWSTEISGAAVVVVTAAASGCRLAVEAEAGPEVR